MDLNAILVVIVILTILMVAWMLSTRTNEHLSDSAGYETQVVVAPSSDNTPPTDTGAKSMLQMTDGERLQFIVDTYFTEEDDSAQADQTNKENKYINSLPVDGSSCTDSFDDCAKWAANGDCNINPEYMLYNCPSSCNACSLTPQQKHNITVIYNNRDPPNCANHGKNYPGPFPYLNRLYTYTVHYR